MYYVYPKSFSKFENLLVLASFLAIHDSKRTSFSEIRKQVYVDHLFLDSKNYSCASDTRSSNLNPWSFLDILWEIFFHRLSPGSPQGIVG